ncbi:MAG: hypothetical protein AAGA92_11280 [Planctomycetota bacterium]
MDQIRTIVKVMWRERFWLLTLLCLITGLVCWSSASGTISSAFDKNKSEIERRFSDIQSLSGQQVNDEVNKGDLEQARTQRNYVRQVWAELYNEQSEQVLQWPDEKVLSKEFVEKIEGKEFRDPIDPAMRSLYWNYIEKQFTSLLDIVKARETDGVGGGGRPGRGGYGGYGGLEEGGARSPRGEEEEKDYLVEWVDQGTARAKLSFQKRPSSTQIWVVQEDLWVYETLLKVIADTNEARGATRPDNTAVSEIIALEIGDKAAAKANAQAQIIIPSGEASLAGGYGGEGGYGGYGGEGGRGGRGGYGGEGGGYGGYGGEGGRGGYGGEGGRGGYGAQGAVSDEELLANRYVDETGAAVSADSLGAEFRRLPVRLNLTMDERWLPQLLLQCANSPLPIVVERVRINADQAGAGFGGPRAGRTGRSVGRGRSQGPADTRELATIDVQGVVYIYNPPTDEVLSLPGDDELAAEGDGLAAVGDN